jgi:hypothetical protein
MKALTLVIALATFLLVACGDDEKTNDYNGTGGTTAVECGVPESQHQSLITKPTDAVVVKKTPSVSSE